MFTVRATETWGAPETVQQLFLLERKLDLPTQDQVVQGRCRKTGARAWVKFRDGSTEAREALAVEAGVLNDLGHPHILPLVEDGSGEAGPYLRFRWSAEEPLNDDLLERLQAVDRTRLADELVAAVSHLQALPQPVAHGQLVLENLWVTPRTHCLRLAGFGQARSGAGADELRADRQAVVSLVDRLLAANEMAPAVEKEIRLFGTAWVDDPTDGLDHFAGVLKRVLLGCVTVDL